MQFYKTAITVLLACPSPDLFIAITRYSSWVFSGWSTKVDSVSIAVATSCPRSCFVAYGGFARSSGGLRVVPGDEWVDLDDLAEFTDNWLVGL